jgi:hypothetical protein
MPAVTRESNTRGNTSQAVRVAACGLLAAGALAAGACHSSSSGPEHEDPAAWAWNAPVAAPATVFVRNTNGSVKVRPATGGNVEVTASVRWRRGDPKRDLKFQAVTVGNNVTICALWGDGTCSASGYKTGASSSLSDRMLSHGTDATVALTVYVPTGVKVDAFTVNGSSGAAATAPVTARTINGTIKVATSVGPVDAATVNGDVDVRMTTLGADAGPISAHSVNGSVNAYVPEKFDGTVDMRAVLGGVTSDFPGATKQDGDKKLTATIGAGGREVHISTVTGSAGLHKLKADGTVAAP